VSDKRQKNQLVLAFPVEDTGEAPRAAGEGTESLTAKRQAESPAIGERLMEEVCERENCKQALARVKANKGSPGVDGMSVHELPGYLKQHWPAIREQLRSGTYEPQPVRRVEIPKPDGGAEAWHPDGTGPIYPASGDAGPATQVGPDVFQSQLRVSARALGASGGGSGAAVYCRRLLLVCGLGPREIFRPGLARQTDGQNRNENQRSAHAEADSGVSESRGDGRRAGKSGG